METHRDRPVSVPEPEGQARGVRPDLGFDRERAAYARAKPDLIRTAQAQFVVFVGGAMIGPFPTSREAARAGWQRFGPGPLYVKQVLAEDPVEDLRPVAATCRP